MARQSKRATNSRKSFQLVSFLRFESLKKIQQKIKKLLRKGVLFIDKKPMTAFFAILGLLLFFIVVGSIIRKPKIEKAPTPQVKDVKAYSIGSAPTIKVQAQIEKTGVIKIIAQTPGVVASINVVEGQQVAKGTALVALSSNYQGGNAAGIQREIATATYQNTKSTFDTQKEIIKKQREIAEKTDANADQLRDITSKSVEDTKSLLNLNQEIVSSLQSSLSALETNNQNGQNDSQILQTKQIISQYQSAVNQLQSGLRNSEYQASSGNPPANLSDLGRDIAQKQFDLQEKALNLSLEVSTLQLKLALIQEASMYPAAPFSGVVERIFVNPGEAVNPGTPIAIVHGAQTLKAVVKIPRDIAQKISKVDMARIFINGKNYQSAPMYISTEATDGSLYSAIFEIPDDYQNELSDNEYVTVELPIGFASTSTSVPFIPLDAIYQGTNGSYLFVINNGKAVSRNIQLGQIVGQFAQVTSGLLKGDQIILSRTVINGDLVRRID